jgi:transcriptional regulator with XRE-family HTH domain
MPKLQAKAVFPARLKQTRKGRGFSQLELGVRMGLPDEVAQPRINRYERGVHLPDIETAERMAQELGVPLAYLLTADERLASAILGLSRLPAKAQDAILAQIEAALGQIEVDHVDPTPTKPPPKKRAGRGGARA